MTGQVCIVGAGAIGTYALERLAAYVAAAPPAAPLNVVVVEASGKFGDGLSHDRDQPRTSYLNRVTSQVSFAADESNRGETVVLDAARRPTLYEWARRMFDETGDPQFDVRPEEYPRRYLHGMALAHAFSESVERLRAVPNVSVELRSCAVVDVQAATRDGRIVLGTSDGRSLAVDHLLLAMGSPLNPQGYPSREPRGGPAQVSVSDSGTKHVYPLADNLSVEALPPQESVGVRGMGPTCIDALLYMTEGRGGRFETNGSDGRLRYVPSGREPRIHVFSRNGEYTHARAVNQKALDGSGRSHAAHTYVGEFLTHAAVALIRERHGRPTMLSHGETRQIDFEKHLLPLVAVEMAVVYYRTLLGTRASSGLSDAVRPAVAAFLAAPDESHERSIDVLLAAVEQHVDVSCESGQVDLEHVARVVEGWHGGDRFGEPGEMLQACRFSWASLTAPVATRRSAFSTWHDALLDFMHADVRAATQGNLDNPVKAASDAVWRDLRPVLAEAIEFGGLTPPSHERFVSRYWRLYSRMSNGLGLEAMRKVAALMESGVVRADLGPGVTVSVAGNGLFCLEGGASGARATVSHVVDARVPCVDVETSGGLLGSLAGAGLVRAWENVSGDGRDRFVPGTIDITRQNHPVTVDGVVDERVTVLGAATEGPQLFQLAAARPHADSSILNKCGDWARRVVARLADGPGVVRADAVLDRA